jgi:branched-chain amino acid transport system ATP-binding protein
MLQVEDISVRFGGVMALQAVSFEASAGQVTGLIGPNGAGKTTMFNVLSGLQRPTTGRVRLGGQDITTSTPQQRAKLGMARTFQRLELFGSLSVLENVQAVAETARRKPARQLAGEILERVGLAQWADRGADSLPTGTARLLEVARALAGGPSLILLDEPGAGLSESESGELGSLLLELASDGIAVLLVEHDMELVMRVCHTVVVLDTGTLLTVGTPQEIAAHPAVQAAYLGSAVSATA